MLQLVLTEGRRKSCVFLITINIVKDLTLHIYSYKLGIAFYFQSIVYRRLRTPLSVSHVSTSFCCVKHPQNSVQAKSKMGNRYLENF